MPEYEVHNRYASYPQGKRATHVLINGDPRVGSETRARVKRPSVAQTKESPGIEILCFDL